MQKVSADFFVNPSILSSKFLLPYFLGKILFAHSMQIVNLERAIVRSFVLVTMVEKLFARAEFLRSKYSGLGHLCSTH